MFPIFDAQGDCVAFGGRVIGTGEPKYLNSQETPLFHKSQVLYGLNQAKARMASTGCAIVVEGYTDVIALHEAGRHQRGGHPGHGAHHAAHPGARQARAQEDRLPVRRRRGGPEGGRSRPGLHRREHLRQEPQLRGASGRHPAEQPGSGRVRASGRRGSPGEGGGRGAAAHRVRPRAAPRQLRLGHGARPRSRAGRVPGGARPHQGHAGGEGLRRAHLVAPAGPWPSRHRGGRRAGAAGGPGGAPRRRRGGDRARGPRAPACAPRAFPGRAQPPALRAGVSGARLPASRLWGSPMPMRSPRCSGTRRCTAFWPRACSRPSPRTRGPHRPTSSRRRRSPRPMPPACSPPGRPTRRAPRRPSAPTWPRSWPWAMPRRPSARSRPR